MGQMQAVLETPYDLDKIRAVLEGVSQPAYTKVEAGLRLPLHPQHERSAPYRVRRLCRGMGRTFPWSST